jgi:hypothetical protein
MTAESKDHCSSLFLLKRLKIAKATQADWCCTSGLERDLKLAPPKPVATGTQGQLCQQYECTKHMRSVASQQ